MLLFLQKLGNGNKEIIANMKIYVNTAIYKSTILAQIKSKHLLNTKYWSRDRLWLGLSGQNFPAGMASCYRGL